MDAKELLREAWKKIDSPEKWGRGSGMRKGIYCSVTALLETASPVQDLAGDPFRKPPPEYHEALKLLRAAMYPQWNGEPATVNEFSIVGFNDGNTYEKVSEAWKRAME